jgi:phospholipase A1
LGVNRLKKLFILGLFGLSFQVWAGEALDACVLEQMKHSDQTKTYSQWVAVCTANLTSIKRDAAKQDLATQKTPAEAPSEDSGQTLGQTPGDEQPLWQVMSIAPITQESMGSITKRFIRESGAASDPFVIAAHRRNYLLPVYTTNAINRDAYSELSSINASELRNVESKFQLSFKIPLNSGDMFVEHDRIYFGFTLEAWWQIYAAEISRPFRETNYRPEVLYLMPTNWHPLGGNVGLAFGLEHQSNGQMTALSRSWNRVYTNVLYENGAFVASLQPWYRLPEDSSDDATDSSDDDNPDIEDYMGHFTLNLGYSFNDSELTFMGRQNFETGYGAREVTYSFPLWGRVRGYASLFDGYGDSMIDYNYQQTRVGLGVVFSKAF